MSHSLHLLRQSVLAPSLLLIAGVAAAADATSGFRLSVASLPKDGETEATIKNDLGETVASSTAKGTLDSNYRVTAQMVTIGGTDPIGMGLAWGPYYGRVVVPNDLDTLTHHHFGLTVEPMVVWDPISQLSLEGSVSGSIAYAQGEMVLTSSGGQKVTEKSKIGMAYDVTLHLRPVWHPTKKIDLFAEVSYTPFMQERYNYQPSGMEVVEVDTYSGVGFAAGGGIRF